MADEQVEQIDGGALLDEVEEWFGNYIAVTDDRDLALAALWTVSTHLAVELFTTARFLIDSTAPGSGKTTLLDHIGHLACAPLHVAAISSSAVLVRSLQGGVRTLLIDEVDRSLAPNKPGVEDLIAILNSGYRRGASRPVLVPAKGGEWKVSEMPTFAPVAMAGNSPRLPDDTRSRSIRILLMPDRNGRVRDSDWEVIEEPAHELRDRIVAWADQVREGIVGMPVDLPADCIGRNKEKWRPLKRVAVAAGSHWPEIADELITRGMAETAAEHDAGLSSDPPGLVMLKDLYAVWPGTEPFVPTEQLVAKLIAHNPEYWGMASAYGKALTARRLGVLVSQAAKVTSTRLDRTGPRGYARGALAPIWDRLGVPLPQKPGASGSSGASGENSSSEGYGGSYRTAPDQKPHDQSGAGDHEPAQALDLHIYPDAPDEPDAPDVSETPTSQPLRIVTSTPRPSAPAWFRTHIASLIAEGVTTVESRDVYAAGQTAGYSIDSLRQAATKSDLIATIARTAGSATWRLGAGNEDSVITCTGWLLGWLREQDGWVRAADGYTAGQAAGYGRTAIKSAAKDSPAVLKRGSSVATEWCLDPNYSEERSA